MVARVIGASEVRLLDISRRGVLLETQTRLQFGAKATIRFATCDASVGVRAHVVRSRVAHLGEAIVYHTALTFDEELHLADVLAEQQQAAAGHQLDEAEADGVAAAPEPLESPVDLIAHPGSMHEPDLQLLETDEAFATDGSVLDDNGEILLTEALNLLVKLDDDLESLQRRADAHGDAL
jgi:hypothetical protein